jgi:hypothetical protein
LYEGCRGDEQRRGALMGSQDFSNPHGWPIGVRVVQGGGCKSGDADCFCAERTGLDPGQLWAVVDIYDIDFFDEGDPRPRVIA